MLRRHTFEQFNRCKSCVNRRLYTTNHRNGRLNPGIASVEYLHHNGYRPFSVSSSHVFINNRICDKDLCLQSCCKELPRSAASGFQHKSVQHQVILSQTLSLSDKPVVPGIFPRIRNLQLLANKNAFDAFTVSRTLHSSLSLWDIERSKVEKAVTVLKETIHGKETTEEKKDIVPSSQETSLVDEKSITKDVVPKKSLGKRIWAEVLHYYHGFRLLLFDVRTACRYLWRLANGKTLSRRERRQLVRTTADLFRLAPFSVFIIVPFMEFLLPVALKIFPNMLPSTFKEENKEVEKQRKRLKVKLEMAKFLQDTIEDSAVQKRKGAKGESIEGFVTFMEKIRSSGEITTNEDILKYAKIFEDEITLDNLNFRQLRALCLLLEIPLTGVSETVMRFQLELKLRRLEADDRLIMKEGIDSLATWELQEACRARGMRSLGCTEERLKSQLSQWLELHLHHKLPTSLLLLSRTLYLPETIDTPSQIKATLSELAVSAETEAKVKISELTGERVDTKAMLEVLKQEEKLIKAEKLEAVKELLKEKEEEETRRQQEAERVGAEVLVDSTPVLKEAPLPVQDTKDTEILEKMEKEDISVEDLGKVEKVLDYVADERRSFKEESKILKELKEDIDEYKDQVEFMKEVITTTGESKAARILGDRVSRMIGEMDNIIDTLGEKKETLQQEIDLKQDKTKDEESFADKPDTLQQIKDEIIEEKKDLISINELQEAMRSLQNIADETKMTKVLSVLDDDEDGVIGISEALKVIELLSRENASLAPKQVTQIVDLVLKEQQMLQDRKARKLQEKLKKKKVPTATLR